MFKANDISRIKSSLSDNIGQKVRLTSKRGRKKAVVRMGVIESTYPSIFTIQLEASDNSSMPARRVSYSYSDVLTKAIEIHVFPNKTKEEAMGEPA